MSKTKNETRIKLIKALLDGKSATTAELMASVAVSRTTLLKELEYFIGKGIIVKRGRSYFLSESVAVIILKVHNGGGELVLFCRGQSEPTRQALQFSLAKSYEDNLVALSENALAHSELMRGEFSTVKRCLIYDGNDRPPCTLDKRFDMIACREELFASALSERSLGATLYISRSSDISFIFRDGAAVTRAKRLPEDIPSALFEALALIKPDTVLLEGLDAEEAQRIADICKESSIEFRCLEGGELSYDEYEMIARCISE